MLLECCAIIALLLVTSAMIIRAGKGRGYGVGVAVLTLVPALHIIGSHLSAVVGRLTALSNTTSYILIDLVGLVVTCLVIGALSMRIKSVKKRVGYLILCGGFSVVLTFILIVGSIIP